MVLQFHSKLCSNDKQVSKSSQGDQIKNERGRLVASLWNILFPYLTIYKSIYYTPI